MREHKFWGHSTSLHKDDYTELILIEVDRGGFCSRHHHEHKTNIFWVISGELQVRMFKEEDLANPIDTVFIRPNYSPLEVPALAIHQFFADEPVVAYELYRALPAGKLRENDIFRYDEGGNVNGGTFDFEGKVK